jgi:hypothetical protein
MHSSFGYGKLVPQPSQGNKKPLRVEIIVSPSERFDADPLLISGLTELMCLEEENCSIHLKCRGESPGLVVLLRRQKEVLAEPRWITDPPKDPYHPYIYATVFETESTKEVLEAVKHVLEIS